MAIWLPGRQKLWCMSSNGGTSVANAHLSPPWPAHPPQRCRRRRRLGWTFGNIIENFYRKLCWRCSTATAAAQWQQKQTYCSLPAAKTRIKHYSPLFFLFQFFALVQSFVSTWTTNADTQCQSTHASISSHFSHQMGCSTYIFWEIFQHFADCKRTTSRQSKEGPAMTRD